MKYKPSVAWAMPHYRCCCKILLPYTKKIIFNLFESFSQFYSIPLWNPSLLLVYLRGYYEICRKLMVYFIENKQSLGTVHIICNPVRGGGVKAYLMITPSGGRSTFIWSWYFMVFYGIVWSYIVLVSFVWSCRVMIFYGILWYCVVLESI